MMKRVTLTAILALQSCKPQESAELQSLDQLASEKVVVNHCGPSTDSSGYDVYDDYDILVDPTKASEQQVLTVKQTRKAVPPFIVSALLVASNPGISEDTPASETKGFVKLDADTVCQSTSPVSGIDTSSGFKGCLTRGDTASNLLTIHLEASDAAIRHSLLKLSATAFLLLQLARNNDALEGALERLALAVVADLKNIEPKGGKAEASASAIESGLLVPSNKRNIEILLAAEAIDSYYCNGSTRESMTRYFRSAWDAFAPVIQLVQGKEAAQSNLRIP